MANVGFNPVPIEAVPAQPPREGLLTTFGETTGIAEWKRGITYKPEGVNGSVLNICAPGQRVDPVEQSIVAWMPYILSVSVMCSTFSNYIENAARAIRAMNADTERMLGSELWDGHMAKTATDGAGDPLPNEWLAHQTVDNLTPTGCVNPLDGFACLEQYLFDLNSGQPGVIHATAQVATYWAQNYLITRQGNKLISALGTLVVVSPGYSGNNPDGFQGNHDIWAYATDIPRIFLGDIDAPKELVETTDYRDNTVVYQVQRKALVEWELARHGGVQLCINPCGEGGS